ncbi:MAG: adaptor protein MecA [Clostridia bacterium]|nr:adaptor protein MecA [Clostridia bacterium]
MTVSRIRYKNNRYKEPREFLFVFSDCDSLTSGMLFLYRLKKAFKSELYKNDNEYRLIISSNSFKPYFFTLCEYCMRSSRNIFEIELTKEYGKPLILGNAVKVYGKYFSKDF